MKYGKKRRTFLVMREFIIRHRILHRYVKNQVETIDSVNEVWRMMAAVLLV